MTNVRKPDFTLHRKIGRTIYCIHGYFKQDTETTYEDKLLELIRSGALQMDASAMQEEPPAEHAA